MLSGKGLPFMSDWTHRYLRAMRSDSPIEDLVALKLESATAARAAIGDLLKFCEGCHKAGKAPLSLWTRLSAIGRRLMGKRESDENDLD